MKKYFSYNPNGSGFCFHDTAGDARTEAEKALDAEAEEAAEGWSEEVTDICWGEVRQGVVEKNRRKATEEDCCYPDCDEFVEYAIEDNKA